MDQFCKEYAATYPDFKEKIYIRVIIKPSDGSDAPQEYRKNISLIPILIKEVSPEWHLFYL